MHLVPSPKKSVWIAALWLASWGCATPHSLPDPRQAATLPAYSRRTSKLNAKGLEALEGGDLAGAKRSFELAIQSDDSAGVPYNNLGLVYFEAGDLYSASWSFQRALERMPDQAEPTYNLGLAMEEAQRLEEAEGLYQSAHLLAPTNPRFLGNLVRVKMKQGASAGSVEPELRKLLLLETRPAWREWAIETLNYRQVKDSVSRDRDSVSYADSAYEEIDASMDAFLPTQTHELPLLPPLP